MSVVPDINTHVVPLLCLSIPQLHYCSCGHWVLILVMASESSLAEKKAKDNPEKATHYDNSEEETEDNEFSKLRFPKPWKWERWFPGGYNRTRMIKFKNPETMYKAINLLAGIAIMV